MRLLIFALLQVLVFLPIASVAADSVKPLDTQKIQKAGITEAYGRLPLYFMENKGQVDKAVKFYEKGAEHSTFFTEEGVVLTLTKSEARDEKNVSLVEPGLKKLKNKKFTTEALRLSFVGANKEVKITSTTPLPGHVNYFIGNDKTKWQSNIPTYKAVTYENIYDNIDVKFYGNNRDIEHDIIVRPGADPSVVRFAYEGIKGLEIRDNGDLKVSLHDGIIIEKRPIIYQVINGERKSIKGSYKIFNGEDSAFAYGYDVASYDTTKELVIDPVLEYSTYLGGSLDDLGLDIAVDTLGNAYVTGWTKSIDFPVTGHLQKTFGGVSDAFITKINASGSAMVYSTYIGGSDLERGNSIAVDASGNVYITGDTWSTDFPLVAPIQNVRAGALQDAFITKIDPTGAAIVYSTYLGGSNGTFGKGIAIDSTGAAYVTGITSSTDFPLVAPVQAAFGGGLQDGFVTKIDSAGASIVYSTYLGGNSFDQSWGIAVDSSGAAYVTGSTSSTDFPVMNPIQGAYGGDLWDAFVTKIDPTGTSFLYSTYIGGTITDNIFDIAVDSTGAAYVVGITNSSDFPLMNPIQVAYSGGGWDIFVAKINPAGSALLYSTYLGGSDLDMGYNIALDQSGAAYVTGETWSMDFPLINSVQGARRGSTDAFVTKINPTGSALLFSTYLGGSGDETGRGIAADSSGAIYVTGETISLDFPLVAPIQGIFGGGSTDVFISKIDTVTLPPLSLVITPNVTSIAQGSTLGYNVTATNTTAVTQCFQYWENITLTNGSTYPTKGELFGPIRLCLNAGVSKTKHLTHGVPLTAPLGSYALNAFAGAYAFPVLPVVVNEAHFTFDVTALGPMTKSPSASWR